MLRSVRRPSRALCQQETKESQQEGVRTRSVRHRQESHHIGLGESGEELGSYCKLGAGGGSH